MNNLVFTVTGSEVLIPMKSGWNRDGAEMEMEMEMKSLEAASAYQDLAGKD